MIGYIKSVLKYYPITIESRVPTAIVKGPYNLHVYI